MSGFGVSGLFAHLALSADKEDAEELSLFQKVNAAVDRHALPVHTAHDGQKAPTEDALRVQHQRDAITSLLSRAGLSQPHHTIVECGAGNGALSQTLFRSSGAAGPSGYLLIDRKQQALQQLPSAARFEEHAKQLWIDVANLQPEMLRGAVADQACQACVLLSNHMCGGALDQAVRCAVGAWDGEARLAGVVAVTCCHHLCTWESYLGAAYFESLGMGAAEFEAVRRWSRMAPRRGTPADRRQRVADAATRLGIGAADAARFGLRCRQLLDSGRAYYLQQRGFDVQLLQHVPFSFTADNVMLLAVRARGQTGAGAMPDGAGGAQSPRQPPR